MRFVRSKWPSTLNGQPCFRVTRGCGKDVEAAALRFLFLFGGGLTRSCDVVLSGFGVSAAFGVSVLALDSADGGLGFFGLGLPTRPLR